VAMITGGSVRSGYTEVARSCGLSDLSAVSADDVTRPWCRDRS